MKVVIYTSKNLFCNSRIGFFVNFWVSLDSTKSVFSPPTLLQSLYIRRWKSCDVIQVIFVLHGMTQMHGHTMQNANYLYYVTTVGRKELIKLAGKQYRL